MQRNQGLVRLHAGVFGIILALLPVSPFLTTWGGTHIGPLLLWKSWKEVLIGLLAPFTVWLLVKRRDIVRLLWRRWVNRAILAYVALHMLMAGLSIASPNAVLAGLAMNLRFLAIFVIAQIIVAGLPGLQDWVKQRVPWWLFGVAVVLAILAIVQVMLLPPRFLADFGYDSLVTIPPFLHVDDNPEVLRAFATLRGPNDLGAFFILPLCIMGGLLAYRLRLFAIGGIVLTVFALVLTASRSAWLGAMTAAAVLGIAVIPRKTLHAWVKWGAVPALIVGGICLWLATTVPALRLAIFHSSPGDPTLFEGSTEAHWHATADGVHTVAQHPFGLGVGAAGPASFYNFDHAARIPENYFVQIAIETGLFGLALFAVISALVARHFWLRRQQLLPRALIASFAGLTVINLFLHGWADDPVSITWWGLAGLLWAEPGKKT